MIPKYSVVERETSFSFNSIKNIKDEKDKIIEIEKHFNRRKTDINSVFGQIKTKAKELKEYQKEISNYQKIIEKSPLTIIKVENDEIVFINTKGIELFGKQILNKKFKDIFILIEEIEENIFQVYEKNNPERFFKIYSSDKIYYQIIDNTFEYNSVNNIIHSNKNLYSIFEGFDNIGFCLEDMNNNILYSNKTFNKIFFNRTTNINSLWEENKKKITKKWKVHKNNINMDNTIELLYFTSEFTKIKNKYCKFVNSFFEILKTPLYESSQLVGIVSIYKIIKNKDKTDKKIKRDIFDNLLEEISNSGIYYLKGEK